MRQIQQTVYMPQELVNQINTELEDAGNSFSARVKYCVRQQLQREVANDE